MRRSCVAPRPRTCLASSNCSRTTPSRSGAATPPTATSTRTVGFDAIAADAANDVVVVERRGTIIGTVQLTRTPGMTRRGATRLTVESVRVAEEARGAGVGSALLAWVGDVAAPAVGASLLQLTSDARRSDAIRWYERAGFTASHIGLKRDVR